MEKNKGLLSQGANQVDPKIQEECDIFVTNGIQIIHDEKVSDNLIRQIKGNKDPIEAIAQATLSVVGRLEESAAQNGMKISDAAKIHGSNQLMGEVISVAEAAGMQPLNEEQRYQAFSLAVSKYIDKAVKSGKMTKEQLMQMSQEAQQSPEGQKIAQQMNPSQQTNIPQQGNAGMLNTGQMGR